MFQVSLNTQQKYHIYYFKAPQEQPIYSLTQNLIKTLLFHDFLKRSIAQWQGTKHRILLNFKWYTNNGVAEKYQIIIKTALRSSTL